MQVVKTYLCPADTVPSGVSVGPRSATGQLTSTICTVAPAVRELGTFRLRSGELVHCRIDRSGRLAAYCEAGAKLVPCDLQLVLDAVKLSDDPDWLTDGELVPAEAAGGD